LNGFEFYAPGRIIFGLGSISRLAELAAGLGRRALVAHSPGLDVDGLVKAPLSQVGVDSFILSVLGEPTLESVDLAVQYSRSHSCDCVISLGGGSAIDTGKAVSVLHVNPGQVLDYLEVVGSGKSIQLPGLPHIAVPTTSGTGAEATRNAVIGVPQKSVKVSLRSPYLFPSIALVDPQLTLSLLPRVTASTGLDALTQLMEAYISNKANPFSDAFCRAGLKCISRSLRQAFRHGEDLEARQDMSLAALMSGLALANARLGLVHGFAGVIGGMFNAPHGAICAALLPGVMEANVEALRDAGSSQPALDRYLEISRLLTGDPAVGEDDGTEWVRQLCKELSILPLSSFGISSSIFPEIVEKALRASSTQGNPVVLPDDRLFRILEQAL